MAKFDLGDFAKTMQAVPDSGTTAPERIDYIPLAELHEDERNFYAVSGVEELAANIQLCGLMDPLRVRKAEDGYTIVSGHRRFAALKLLAAEDAKFEKAACIIDTGDAPAALQELRLIYANSDTRKMSAADIGKQAERVEALLYELKEQGMEFPGRMRDHVAEACKVSKTKLSRLAVIQSRLAPDIRKAYWDGSDEVQLSEATAYAMARLPVDLQRQIVDEYRRKNQFSAGLRWMPARIAEKVSEYTKGLANLRCSQSGEACAHRAGKKTHIVSALVKSTWTHPDCNRLCCADCPVLASCRDICPKCKDKQRQVKADNKANNQRARLEQEARERPVIEQIQRLQQRFIERWRLAGISVDDYANRLGCSCAYIQSLINKIESGEAITPNTYLPYGYSSNLDSITRWCAAADVLGCSVDYLMMRTDEPLPVTKPIAEQQTLLSGWMPSGTNPAHDCDCLVMIDISFGRDPSKIIHQFAYWCDGAFRYDRSPSSDPVHIPVLAWMEIPEWKGGNGDA